MMPKAIGGQRWKRAQSLGYLALMLVVGHLAVLGWKGWMTPEKWSGMPPVSLVGFTFFFIGYIINLFGRE